MIIEKTGRTQESMIGDDLVLFDLHGGQFKSLSGVALFAWRALDETGDPVEIKRRIAERYEVAADVLEVEVDAFLAELEQAGYVAGRDGRVAPH